VFGGKEGVGMLMEMNIHVMSQLIFCIFTCRRFNLVFSKLTNKLILIIIQCLYVSGTSCLYAARLERKNHSPEERFQA
jgi:hypothetical protein